MPVTSPSGPIVAKAEQKSVAIIQDYLMNATDVHAPSAPLIPLKKKKREKKLKKKKKRRGSENSQSSVSTTGTSDASSVGEQQDTRPVGSPVSYLLEELRNVSPASKSPRTFPALQMYNDFEEWSDAQKAAYDRDAIAAIRAQDVDLLRKWHSEGRILQAANSFGESLLHMACRRGFLELVKFLVDEAGHNLWIRDDTGRTPLHDACWTADPCPQLVQYILNKEHDLLWVCDKRGHAPLDYARKNHWEFWIQYFGEEYKDSFDRLLPQRDCFYIQTPAAAVTPEPTTTTASLDDQNTETSQLPPVVMLENVDGMLEQLHLDMIQNTFDDYIANANQPTRRSSCPGVATSC